ncbi:protein kinase [Amycolatopsis sp. NBC_01488]|uniref:serine/threonine-protein kinase n=1 Tax=Amycolatopsis sp. NBC_01488 TaxID=2903563 RepID=UPI002E2BC3B5|nr:protein kinase [Amycolatopsis sp. NBC_01488]
MHSGTADGAHAGDGAATSPRYSLDVAGVGPWWARDEPPEVIAGRYEIGGLIGSGGTARVYQAFDRRMRRDVAVKVYDRGAVAVEQLRRAREKTIQASIDHPRVVALFDSGTDGDRPYLVMQLVAGENLAQRLLGGPLPVEQVTELAAQLAEALAHVHDRRVVHRDLKPANVLLGGDGPLISDFGIAHELDSTHVTGTGLVTGTAAYLAPEQVVGERAGPAADVYALGLILLECLTAEREYPGTLAESATARLHRPPRVPAGLPAPLARTLERMTAREPADRPAAGEILELLREPAPAPTRRRKLVAAGGLVTAGTAVVLAVLLTRPDVAGPDAGEQPVAGSVVPSSTVPSTPVSASAPVTTVLMGSSQGGASVTPGLAAVPLPPPATSGAVHATGPENGKAKGKTKGNGPVKGKGQTGH